MKYAILDNSDLFYIEEVYTILSQFESDYPDLYGWYFTKVVPNLRKDREIIVCLHGETLVGVSILKYSESKVCTLYVTKYYRNKGIGSKLLELSCKTLKVSKPLITVNNMVLDYYLSLFFKRNFKLVKTYRDYYVKNRVEYSFNGKLLR